MDYFTGFVGQDGVKRKLGFYIDAFKQSRRIPFILLSAAKGCGKTEIARQLAKALTREDGSPRPTIELNCATIGNNQMFFENIFLQFINHGECNVIWDESHNIPKDLTQALLTICNTEKSPIKTLQMGENNLTFDFTKVSFIFATTEADRIFAPLKDRLEVVDFAPYTEDEMIQILELNSEHVRYSPDVMPQIVTTLRGNARSCVKMAQSVNLYCEAKRDWGFNVSNWIDLCRKVDVLPHGLTNTELSILRALVKRGPLSLQMLSSIIGMSRSAIQKDVEPYLIKKDFMRIDLKRKVTEAGMKAVVEIERLKTA